VGFTLDYVSDRTSLERPWEMERIIYIPALIKVISGGDLDLYSLLAPVGFGQSSLELAGTNHWRNS